MNSVLHPLNMDGFLLYIRVPFSQTCLRVPFSVQFSGEEGVGFTAIFEENFNFLADGCSGKCRWKVLDSGLPLRSLESSNWQSPPNAKKNAKVWQNLTAQSIQGFDVTFHANAGRIILTPSELPLKRRIIWYKMRPIQKQKIMPWNICSLSFPIYIQKKKQKKNGYSKRDQQENRPPPKKKKKNGWFPTPHTTTPFSKLSLLTRSRPQECSNDPDRRRCFPHFEGKSKCTNQRRKWRNFAGTKMVLQWILWLHSMFYKENTTGGSIYKVV